MSSPQAINARGGFNTSTQKFLIVAISNNTLTSDDAGKTAPSGGPIFFLLSKFTYGKVNDDSSYTDKKVEAVFTPFFNQNYSSTGKNNNFEAFLQLAQGTGTAGECLIQENHPGYFPFYSNDTLRTQQPYKGISITPALMSMESTNGNYSLFCYDENNVKQQLWAQSGDKSQGNPYEYLTYIGAQQNGAGNPTPSNSAFSLAPFFEDDIDQVIRPPVFYSGYPYRIISTNQSSDNTIFPFRNFLPQFCHTSSPPIQPPNIVYPVYVNYRTLNFSHGGDLPTIQFPGQYYDDGVLYDVNNTSSPGVGHVWNFANDKFTGSNLNSTTQIYFVPLSYNISSGSINSCVPQGSLSDPTEILNGFIKSYFQQNPSQCDTQINANCIFADTNECNSLNGWYDYCLSSSTQCGICFGSCPSTTNSDNYCRVAYQQNQNIANKTFACGDSPQPAPAPAPSPGQTFWELYSKDIIIIVAIFVAIFILIAVFVVMSNRDKS